MGRHPKDCNCENCKKDNKEEIKQPIQSEQNKDFEHLMKEYENKYNAKPASKIVILPKIRTGIYALDYVLSGGIAQCEGGHKIEFHGRESSGKTTMALKVISKYQELNKTCVFINAENSYDPQWAEINGVNNEKLLVLKPDTLEQAGDILIDLIPKVDLIVIDSIIALIPAEELEGSLEDKHMASSAKINAPLCRRINQTYKDFKTTIIFINQIREKVGIMYGNPETTSGGRALRHLYDTTVEIKTGKSIEISVEGLDKKERIGNETILINKKNKKGVPFRQTIVDFYLTGILDNRKSLLYAGIKFGIIKLMGNTYSYKDIKAVGKDKFGELLTDKMLKEIEDDIWKSQP